MAQKFWLKTVQPQEATHNSINIPPTAQLSVEPEVPQAARSRRLSRPEARRASVPSADLGAHKMHATRGPNQGWHGMASPDTSPRTSPRRQRQGSSPPPGWEDAEESGTLSAASLSDYMHALHGALQLELTLSSAPSAAAVEAAALLVLEGATHVEASVVASIGSRGQSLASPAGVRRTYVLHAGDGAYLESIALVMCAGPLGHEPNSSWGAHGHVSQVLPV